MASAAHRAHHQLADLLTEVYGDLEAREGKVQRMNSREWNRVESISIGAREYLILCREVTDDAPLTPRERAAVRFAMSGATNKEIAWALGVSASTVGVFLWRAARKLNVTGRSGLFGAFARRYSDDGAVRIDEWQDANKPADK